jgi:hypothetical protein
MGAALDGLRPSFCFNNRDDFSSKYLLKLYKQYM